MLSNSGITWARKSTQYELLQYRLMFSNTRHWSRLFEYPWAAANGKAGPGMWILDAAGGDGQLQTYLADTGAHVINADMDQSRFGKKRDKRIFLHAANVEELNFLDNSFDRVFCISVLEHLLNPRRAIDELYRVLDHSGRLIITFDVANYRRWNHGIDIDRAKEIVETFGLTVPEEPDDILECSLPEIDPTPEEPKEVKLKVLCFFVDK